MIEATYRAILLSAQDYKENDRLLKLLTVEEGIITAVMRGVKKPSSKLRFGSIPFAFCEYTLYKKSGAAIVTGCNQIEDLFSITAHYDSYLAGSIVLEASERVVGSLAAHEVFVLLLHSLKTIIYSDINPFLVAAAFMQKVIHASGYGYEYPPPPNEITSSMGLLSLLNSLDIFEIGENSDALIKTKSIDLELIRITLTKLIYNFEKKFDCELKSKRLITTK